MSALAIDEFSRNPQEKEALVRCASSGKLNKTPRSIHDFFDVDFPERDCDCDCNSSDERFDVDFPERYFSSSDERWIMDLLGMALDLQSPPHLKKRLVAIVRDARRFPCFRCRYFYKFGSTCKSKCIENPCDFLIPCSPDPPTGIYVAHIWWQRYPLQPSDFYGCYDILLFENENENNKTPETLLLFDPDPDPATKNKYKYESLGIFDSCNGVVLCEDSCFTKFCLYNLTVDAYTTLPRPKTNRDYLVIDMVIAFDPNLLHHYQIVAVLETPSAEFFLISVYSSRDGVGVWEDYCHCHSSIFDYSDGHGVFCNHGVYWLSKQEVAYFDLDQKRLHFIDRPLLIADSLFTINNGKTTHIGFHDFLAKSHQGTLLCAVFSSSMRALDIWELGDGLSWSTRYLVDLVDLVKACGLPPPLEQIPNEMSYRQCLDVLYFVDAECEEDTFLVFRANGKAIRYHVASGRSYQLGDIPDGICLDGCCFPFQHASTSTSTSAWTPRKRKPELYPTGEGMKELASSNED